MCEQNSVVDFDLLQSDLRDIGSPWSAAANDLTRTGWADQRRRLGVQLPTHSARELIEARAVAVTAELAITAELAGSSEPGISELTTSPDLPARFDLRDVDGVDYITPTYDRGYCSSGGSCSSGQSCSSCQSCVAFGVTAAIESTARYIRRAPLLDLDRSEAVWSPGDRTDLTGQSDWMPLAAFGQAASDPHDESERPSAAGGTDESAWAYRRHQCIPAGISDVTGSPSRIKEHLLTYGGVTACMEVFSDFFAYRDGVYQHVSGVSQGGLCVLIIGWDDRLDAWIIMNSLGSAWGQGGFGFVRYGEVFIDSWQNVGVTGVSLSAWSSPQKVLGAYSSGDARNGWVYLANSGWLKVGGETEQAHTLLFTDLLAAKSAGAVVNAFIRDELINQVYAN